MRRRTILFNPVYNQANAYGMLPGVQLLLVKIAWPTMFTSPSSGREMQSKPPIQIDAFPPTKTCIAHR
jgi:hypothetical protein